MVLQNNEFDEGIGDTDSLSESWETKRFNTTQYRKFTTLVEVTRFCNARLLRRNVASPERRYLHVAKCLYIEACELKAFLGHVLHNFEVDKRMSLDAVLGPEFAKIYLKDWAKCWLKVMEEIRQSTRRQYELSLQQDEVFHPLEMVNLESNEDLCTTISSLNTFERSDSLPDDAEDRILNFLRERVSTSQEELRSEDNNSKNDIQYKTLKKKLSLPEPLVREIIDWDKPDEIFLEEHEEEEEDEKDLKMIRTDMNRSSFRSKIYSAPHISTMRERRKSKSITCLQEIDIEDRDDYINKIGSSLIEIFKIRQEITRAELEISNDLDLIEGKVCLRCRKEKFNFFQRGNLCSLCRKKYCLNCIKKQKSIIPQHLIYAEPANINITHNDNRTTNLRPRSKSMTNLSLDHPIGTFRNTDGMQLTMCIDCKEFLDSIDREKRKTEWAVRLEWC